MAEYIERGDLINELSASCIPIDDREISGLLGCGESIRDIINAVPAADVRPERHGKRIDKTQWYGHLGRILTQCSECGFEIKGDPTSRNTGMGGKYCENCGAKMNGNPNA